MQSWQQAFGDMSFTFLYRRFEMSIKKVLMERDGMPAAEADDLIQEARETMMQYLEDGEDELAYEICSEMFGLEPDYIMELF